MTRDSWGRNSVRCQLMIQRVSDRSTSSRWRWHVRDVQEPSPGSSTNWEVRPRCVFFVFFVFLFFLFFLYISDIFPLTCHREVKVQFQVLRRTSWLLGSERGVILMSPEAVIILLFYLAQSWKHQVPEWHLCFSSSYQSDSLWCGRLVLIKHALVKHLPLEFISPQS